MIRQTCLHCHGFGTILLPSEMVGWRPVCSGRVGGDGYSWWWCGSCRGTGVTPTATTWQDGVIARSVRRMTKE